ncbi:MAG TPA: DMT family transporter [Anaerolineales bacterium]|nr:DMT family transporter [Anaerolineales bacterium]
MRLKADLLLFLVAIIWGTAFVAQGIAGRYHVAYLFNGISFMIASLILIPFIPRPLRITRQQWFWMLIAGCVLFVATAMQQIGIFYTKVANAGFLTSLYAVFTPFFLFIGFRERPHLLDMIAVVMAVVGAFLLSSAGSFQVHPGDALETIGSVFWALHFVVLGKFASRFESISFASGHFFISGFLNFTVGLFLENLGLLVPLPVLGAIVYRATLSIAIGYTLQVWGQKHTPPTDAALLLGLEAVFAAIAAWIALSQILLPIQIAGCVIIFLAVAISQSKGWSKIDHEHLVEGR